LGRYSLRESAGALQDLDVLHVRIGSKADSLEAAIRFGHHERTVARDLVLLLIVDQLLSGEPASIFRHDHDIFPRDHVVRTRVGRSVARSENRVLRAGHRKKRSMDSLQFHPIVVIEEVCSIGVHVSTLQPLIRKIEAGRIHYLVGGICERGVRLDWRLLFVAAGKRDRRSKNSDRHSDAH
jgi:hypothetical protein